MTGPSPNSFLIASTSFTDDTTPSSPASTPQNQTAELVAAITTTASEVPTYIYGEVVEPPEGQIIPLLAQSNPLINMDDFRNDPRFAGIDGSGFATVILDTGIDLDHPYFGPDGDSDGVADRIVYHYDFANGDADASDYHGHGSNVSSIVGKS